MLKSEMQHQFWVTKKTVQRKLGSKEDEHIISSDAELDSKIDVFKSIAETCTDLCKIIDQYQERLCILSQEESVFGGFLKEVGKRSKSTCHSISSCGKAVSYSGQQRMCVRVPLLRMHHEVEVFRNRAISDTLVTINAMEKERTEYRAALSWMKSSSSELDPDTGKGVDKFRVAQSHVRNAKQIFDSISLDCIQKIDLLAAARCNMYSHVLVSYMSELCQFSEKTAHTFEEISKALLKHPRFDFCVLKDLSQNVETSAETRDIAAIDKDQTLFFSDEYTDKEIGQSEMKISSIIDLDNYYSQSSVLINEETKMLHSPEETGESTKDWSSLLLLPSQKTESLKNGFEYPINNSSINTASNDTANETKKKHFTNSKKMHAWMDFFSELDPLGNPDEFNMKLNNGKLNFQET